jgi:hypothetical protein
MLEREALNAWLECFASPRASSFSAFDHTTITPGLLQAYTEQKESDMSLT